MSQAPQAGAPQASTRCAVVAGPYHSGKTHLFEALLHATGAIHRKGAVAAGTLVGDHQKRRVNAKGPPS